MIENAPVKFSGETLESSIPYHYGNIYQVEDHGSWSRIKIGPNDNHVETMLSLLHALPGPYGLLWVLLVSASTHPRGRYQSPYVMNEKEVKWTLRKYKSFLEQDARHHLWIMNTQNAGQIIYDNHNLIYYYGPVQPAVTVLQDLGYIEKQVIIPSPHCHGYNPKNALIEDELFEEFEWIYHPLVEEHDCP